MSLSFKSALIKNILINKNKLFKIYMIRWIKSIIEKLHQNCKLTLKFNSDC